MIKPTSEQISVVAQEIKKYSYVKNYWVLALGNDSNRQYPRKP